MIYRNFVYVTLRQDRPSAARAHLPIHLPIQLLPIQFRHLSHRGTSSHRPGPRGYCAPKLRFQVDR